VIQKAGFPETFDKMNNKGKGFITDKLKKKSSKKKPIQE
jgi:hypothetical protein